MIIPSQHTDADVRNGQRRERGKIIHGGTDTRLMIGIFHSYIHGSYHRNVDIMIWNAIPRKKRMDRSQRMGFSQS
jgi:hypothetical protein